MLLLLLLLLPLSCVSALLLLLGVGLEALIPSKSGASGMTRHETSGASFLPLLLLLLLS